MNRYLAEARSLILDEIQALAPRARPHSGRLYELMLDYPLREAKALRPALCIATCRALGGRLQAVLRSAAMLELFHNAFLIHDDVEDDSEMRRGGPTLHREHGVATAVNVGDGMLACALQPLLDNTELIGLGPALRVLEVVVRMARESAEGQAIELEWIRTNRWDAADRDYFRMVYKKTAWYSFIAPVLVGAISADADPRTREALGRFAMLLGLAFQVQDDVLNLVAAEDAYGKEIAGDLWEGKHTLILMHTMRCATPAERAEARTILRKGRPPVTGHADPSEERLVRLVEALARGGHADATAVRALTEAITPESRSDLKTADEVMSLRDLVERCGGIQYARTQARWRAERARRTLSSLAAVLPPSVHRGFLEGLVDYVVERDR